MSAESDQSEAVNSCLTARSSDLSIAQAVPALQSRSSSILSGYLADLESSGELSVLGDGGGSEDSVDDSTGNVALAPIPPQHLGQPHAAGASVFVNEQIGDSEQGNVSTNTQLLLEGENSSSAQFDSKEPEEKEEEQVANLRRKRTEADGPDCKRRRI